MAVGPEGILATVEAELARPLPASATAMAREIAARHGPAVLACLFYGSCLRDGRDENRVLDFYAIVSGYRGFHGGGAMALANALVPPNVYYIELPFEGRRLRAKYAVVSLPAFERDCSARAFVPQLWARMAQPCALAFARDGAVRRRVAQALAAAVATTAVSVLPLLPPRFSPRELWTRAFAESYRTEFRAERGGRAEQLHDAFAERYAALAPPALAGRARPLEGAGAGLDLAHPAGALARLGCRLRWRGRRLAGRTLHLLRLVKNAYTFADGLDYVLWKIEQHSGIRTEPSAWQRRHPLLAAPGLAWRLYRQGAFR